MKMKSIAGMVFYVKDLKQTAKFYETLGFLVTKNEENHLSIRLNWFWIDFHPQDKQSLRSFQDLKEDIPEFQKEAVLEPKGAGEFLYISVEEIDDFYKELIKKGLKPASEPKDYPWGNREFILKDPDGYKLVFFQKK
jgi:catechol 2,3-dioxygenase-like lactoylglutathione lyase family enzyme